MAWCTQWKGTPQDCIDHIRKKHSVPDSVKAANLGRWFPLWTVTRAAWHKALKPQVSGVSTDVVLFSENGLSLIHHYRVFGRSAAHASLRGTFMTKLRVFTVRAVDDAKWKAGRVPNQAPRLPLSSDSPAPLYNSIRPRGSDDDSPACKVHRAMSPVISVDKNHVIKYCLVGHDLFRDSYDRGLSGAAATFNPVQWAATNNAGVDPASSIRSLCWWRLSHICRPRIHWLPRPVLILTCSRSSVSPVETDRVSISSVDSGDKTDNDKTDIPLPTSRSQSLNHSH